MNPSTDVRLSAPMLRDICSTFSRFALVEPPPNCGGCGHHVINCAHRDFFARLPPFPNTVPHQALEEVSVATPRDLVRLGGFPDVLLEAVRDKLGPERFATLEDKITTKAIADWRVNGERVIERRPWLELWISQ